MSIQNHNNRYVMKEDYESWLVNTLVPDLLEGVSKETIVSLYLPILLDNSLSDTLSAERVSQEGLCEGKVLTNKRRRRPPSKRKVTVEEKDDDLLHLLFKSEIKDPIMEMVINTLDVNQINKLKFAHGIYDGYSLMETGAGVGSFEMIKYARECGEIWDENTCTVASEHGQLEVLKYLREKGCPWDGRCYITSIKNGHLEVLKYLHENTCSTGYYLTKTKGIRPLGTSFCKYATEYEHLEILKYLHENRFPWDEDICKSASENGHLEILKYLHEKGCPWDHWSCQAASYNGRLEILKYLHENGCPWNEDTCKDAASMNGHSEIMSYLDTLSD